MDYPIPLLFVCLLKGGIILLWQNVHFLRKKCHKDWLYKAWDCDISQCVDYTLAYTFTPRFRYFLVREEWIKILFHPLFTTDNITPSDHKVLDSNLQSILTSIWILNTTYHLNLAVWLLRIQNIMSKVCCQHITYYTPSFNLYILVLLHERTWKRYFNNSVAKQQEKVGVLEKLDITLEWAFVLMCDCSDIKEKLEYDDTIPMVCFLVTGTTWVSL